MNLDRHALLIALLLSTSTFAQESALATIGSSTTFGLNASPIDSSWVNRVKQYYQYELGMVDTVYNLGVSGNDCYHGMPTGHVPPEGRPEPNTAVNITRARTLLADLGNPRHGVIIINFPSNNYTTYTIAEILFCLQTMYDESVAAGHRCFVTTTQPRTDGSFGTSAMKKKMVALKDSILNRFGEEHTLNFFDGMYNPADTSMLDAYSSGDNIHFNYIGHGELFRRVTEKNIFPAITGITETGHAISIFPNPVSERITVFNDGEETMSYTIYDISGRTMRSAESTNAESDLIIDVQDFPAGLYFFCYKSGSSTYGYKFIKK